MWWQKYIGIPFLDRGRTWQGVDCGGLLYLIYKTELNIDLPGFDCFYHARVYKEANKVIDEVKKNIFKKIDSPSEMCAVVFARDKWRINERGSYHVGICINEHEMIHAQDPTNVKVTSLSNPLYANDIEGYYILN